MIRVLVVDDATTIRTNIARVLAADGDMQTVGSATTVTGALEEISELNPDVVLIDLDLETGDGLRTAGLIATRDPGKGLVAMGIDDDDASIKLATDAGAHAYLVKPFGGNELIAAIRKTAARPSRTPDNPPADFAFAFEPTNAPPIEAPPVAMPVPSAPAGLIAEFATPTAPPVPTMPPLAAASSQSAPLTVRTIAVVAGKGGVGTTMLATSLALLASSEARLRTALVDMDLQHGDVRRFLRVESPFNIVDLAQRAPDANRDAISSQLSVAVGGVLTLVAPSRPALSSEVSEAFARALVAQLPTLADISVLDLPTHQTAASATILQNVDRIVLVSSMSDPGVRATEGMLNLFNDLHIDRSRVTLVLNRNEANSDLNKAAVEEALGMGVAVQLPYDFVLVSTAVNRGVPFVLQKPEAQVSRKVRELASTLFPLAVQAQPEVVERRPQPLAVAAADRTNRKPKKKGLFGFGKE